MHYTTMAKMKVVLICIGGLAHISYPVQILSEKELGKAVIHPELFSHLIDQLTQAYPAHSAFADIMN